MFIKEQFFIVNSSDIKNENQDGKELPDLVHQQNFVLQKKNASKKTIIKILVENQAAIIKHQTRLKVVF